MNRPNTEQDLFLTCKESIETLVSLAQDHKKYCTQNVSVKKVTSSGHVGVIYLKCKRKHGPHQLIWSSSPKMPNGSYLANQRVLYGLNFSGMRPSHYTRFVQAAGMGFIHKHKRRASVKILAPVVEEEYQESTEDALLAEQAAYVLPQVPEDEIVNSIEIKSNARHGHRQNAKDSSIIAMGERTKQVLHHEHVTKAQ